MLKLQQKPATTEAIKQSWFKQVDKVLWKPVKPVKSVLLKRAEARLIADDDDDIFNNPDDEDLWAESTLGFMNK